MDISKSIIYRGLELNGATLQTGRTLRGIAVENVDYSVVESVGYTEKRAGSDGMHASDVFLGARQVSMSGHIYGSDLADLFDWLHVLRSVLSPTSAYQQDPASRGFLPMHFSQSTHDEESFPAVGADPAGFQPLMMYLRPLRPPNFAIARDRQDRSGADTKHGVRATAIPWQAQLWAKDPRVYIDPGQSKDISGGPWGAGVDAAAMNRGDYETPMNIMLVFTAAPAAGTFQLTGLNGIDMKITVEPKANVVYRWFGDDRVLMTQDISGTVPGPLVLRMDLVSFATKQRKPMVPALIAPPVKPYTSPYRYASNIALGAGSRLFWSEAYA